MKISHPTFPNITLENLLRRRKTNLARFIEATGVTTYELLLERCTRMGVAPPKRETFETLVPPTSCSSPTEGVIVLETPPTVTEGGDEAEELPILSDPYPQEPKRKRRRQ